MTALTVEEERQALRLWGASCAAADECGDTLPPRPATPLIDAERLARPEPFDLTEAPYRRSHGWAPKRQRGRWGFQRSRTREAFVNDLYGEVVFFAGSFVEAKCQLRKSGATGLWAVLS